MTEVAPIEAEEVDVGEDEQHRRPERRDLDPHVHIQWFELRFASHRPLSDWFPRLTALELLPGIQGPGLASSRSAWMPHERQRAGSCTWLQVRQRRPSSRSICGSTSRCRNGLIAALGDPEQAFWLHENGHFARDRRRFGAGPSRCASPRAWSDLRSAAHSSSVRYTSEGSAGKSGPDRAPCRLVGNPPRRLAPWSRFDRPTTRTFCARLPGPSVSGHLARPRSGRRRRGRAARAGAPPRTARSGRAGIRTPQARRLERRTPGSAPQP
jgi:hypothetical protein